MALSDTVPHKLLIFIISVIFRWINVNVNLILIWGTRVLWPVYLTHLFYKRLCSLDVSIISYIKIYMCTESLCKCNDHHLEGCPSVYPLPTDCGQKLKSSKLRKPCCVRLQGFSILLRVICKSIAAARTRQKKCVFWVMFSLCLNIESTIWLLTGMTENKPCLSLHSRFGGLLSRSVALAWRC